jgi:hypothetical protein
VLTFPDELVRVIVELTAGKLDKNLTIADAYGE